jgi:hypothetical protein
MAKHIKKHFWNKRPSEGMKSAVAYTFASLFSKGLAFVTVPIFTRIMSTSEMGTVNLYNSWQSILTVVATLSLTYGGYMVALKEYEHERDRYESSVLTLTTFTSIVFFAVYSVAPNFWSRILGLDKSLLLLMLVGFLLLPATEFWLARQRYEYKYKAATLVTIGSAIVASALSIVAVLYMRGSGKAAEGRLFANYAVLYAVALVLWVYIMVRGRKFISMRYWKFSLALSVPLIANQFATQILNNSGRVMIGWFVDNSAVGIYGTLSSVSTVSAIVWSAINSSFIPLLLDNKDINIFEDGKESRDFIHVKDVASAVIKSINTAASNGEIINLGSGIGTSVIEIAETLKRIYGSTSNLNVTGDFRIGDIAHNVADTQKARKLLDFTPSISLQEGLTEFCEWVLGQETDNSRYEQSLTEMERSGMFIRK